MKRIVSVLVGILMLASLCCLSVSADDSVIVIADNLNSLTYCGNTYVRVENSDGINYDYLKEEKDFSLTKRQSVEITSIDAMVDGYGDAYVVLDIWYKKRENDRTITYVNQTRLEEYNNILNGIGHAYTMQINYSIDDEIVMTADQLKSEAIVMDGTDIPHTNEFAVWVESEDGCFSEVSGALLVNEFAEEYYYLDYFQAGANDYYDLMTDLGTCEDVMLYRITDEDLLYRIEMDYAAYYDTQLMPYTETVGKTLSAAMMILIFGALPVAVLVVGIIGCIRSKRKVYRRLFAALTAICGVEIIAFVACIAGIIVR